VELIAGISADGHVGAANERINPALALDPACALTRRGGIYFPNREYIQTMLKGVYLPEDAQIALWEVEFGTGCIQ